MTDPRRILVTGGSGFIGSHFLPLVEPLGDVLNLDLVAPKVSGATTWQELDIRDAERLRVAVSAFRPTEVVHLAARTDTDSSRLVDYDSNTLGTVQLLAACRPLEGLRRFTFVSTQFVLRPGVDQRDDLHFDPHTTYGESKMIGELMTRAALAESRWVIVRPTNVWGPRHPRYGQEFLKVLDRGQYLHPGGSRTIRTYGYVENVAQQLVAASVEHPGVEGRVFYLGDQPIELRQWTDAFSRELQGKDVRTVPVPILKAIAVFGDGCGRVGVKFPLTSSRLRSMTEDYVTPIDETEAVLGRGDVSLEEGVRRTSAWFRGLRSY